MADEVLERKTCQAGERIFKEGEEGNRAYVVQAGEVEIIKSTGDKDIVLGTIGKGGIFGEMALIDDKPRMASARAAKGGATVIIVSRMMFQKKLAKADPFVRGLLNILSENIRSITGGEEKKVDTGPADPEWEKVDPRAEPE
ncbi:MAG: cyclic nucleotide-binding domain-containing protein [Proteobacteria bacterium]|nr:cyclic nucleotide-binding domain-containing protein [Pseudomonadota bacterium]